MFARLNFNGRCLVGMNMGSFVYRTWGMRIKHVEEVKGEVKTNQSTQIPNILEDTSSLSQQEAQTTMKPCFRLVAAGKNQQKTDDG
jgi:hypothetical protein